MTLSQTTQSLQKYIQDNSNPNNISESEISKKYQELIDCITDHNHLYYIDSAPIISDLEYDQLFDYIKKIEQFFPYMISGNSPTQKLVNQIQNGFEKAEHEYPMLSLENTYNEQDIKDRNQRVIKILNKGGYNRQIYYNIEPKYDGVSIELVYNNGELQQAITRGDGLVGEDVTENIKTIKNIKHIKIDFKGKIYFRGEIVLPKSELIRINQERKEKKLPLYANTRNLTAGSIKQLNPNITSQRDLKCYIYEVKIAEESKDSINPEFWLDIEINPIEYVKKNGFEIGPNNKIFIPRTFTKIEEIIKHCENGQSKKRLQDNFDIDFDGLVIKLDEESESHIDYLTYKTLRQTVGQTAHHPKRAIAYKFPAEQVSTKIESIEFQVGRTGIITPVANLTPVNLSGATISRVSLHNFDFIKDKDIHHDDFVRLQRSGEVIPYITGVIKDRRENNSAPVTAPTTCPSCGTTLTPVDMHYYCQNINCPAQIIEKIIWFVSKNCMDVEGIGDSIVEILVEHKIITNISDLYKLLDFETERVVNKFPGFANKKITEIKNQLQESKNKEFRRLLNGLGISGVGKKTAKDISTALANIISTEGTKGSNGEISLNIITKYLTNPDFMISIYGIGDKIVEGIISYRKTNQELLQNLEKLGLNFDCTPKNNPDETNIEKKGNFCITGSFDFPRPKIIEEMEKNGYIFDSSPNKNTNYMLIGSKPGSKLTKAEELGTKIIKGRENILNKFSFLSEIKIEQTKPQGPEQIGLF